MKELQLTSKRWGQFGALEAIFYISPIVLLAINWYVQHNMVMITHIYNGLYGTIMKLVSVTFWCIAFTYVNNLKSVFRLGKSDSNPLYNKIGELLGDYKKGLLPDNRKLADLNDKFELNGSDLTGTAFYIKKTCYAISAYIVTLLLISMSLYFSRENVRYSQSTFGLSGSSGITAEWAHIFQEIDESFITGEEDINEYTDTEIADMYTGNIPDLSTTKGLNNAARIKQKYAIYKSMTLDWRVHIYCLIVAIIFYFVPNILMKLTQINTEFLRRIDLKKLYTLLVIFTDTTFSAYNMLSLMALQCSVLIKEIYFTRELMAYEPLLLERRKSKVRPDLSAIYSKIFYISDKLQPSEALSDAFEIKKNNNIMDFNEEDQRIENERSRVLMLPVLVILFIVFALVAGPLYTTAMSQINDAIGQW